MRERLRLYIAYCFYYSGLLRFARWYQRRSTGSLIILYYHRADGHLPAHLLYLQRHYHIIPLKEALEEFYPHPEAVQRPKKKAQQDRRMPLVLTFDDGYIDNYTSAWSLLRSLQIPITIFVIPGYVESGECFWWLAPEYLVQAATVEKVSIEATTYTLNNSEDCSALKNTIDRLLRSASSVAERERLLSQFQEALGTTLPERARGAEDLGAFPMNWQHIREMQASGLVSFGAHTMHHPVLAYLSDPTEVQYEIAESRKVLEKQLNCPVSVFAYPIGTISAINDQAVQTVKSAGFRWALTAFEEQNTRQTDAYLLARLPGDTRVHWVVMAAELVGLLGVVSRIKSHIKSYIKKKCCSFIFAEK